jgi:hypothetical protein
MKLKQLPSILALILGLANSASAAMSSAFTYQGRLNHDGAPASGNFDLEFRLAAVAETNSAPFASQVSYATPVSNGVFTVTLDFGSGYFNGDARWIEVAVRATSSGSNFTTLLPRTPLTATPYALFAATASSALTATTATTATSASNAPWNGLAGIPAGFSDGVDNDTTYTAGSGLLLNGNQFLANFSGNGAQNSIARSDHTHFGQSWVGSHTNSGLEVRNTLSSGSAFKGRQGANSLWPYVVTAGVFGESDDGDGVVGMSDFRGVWGRAVSTNAENYGVSGYSPSTSGYGVHGQAGSLTGASVGVAGVASSTTGIGVKGTTTATNGVNYGGRFLHASAGGAAVYGQSTRGVAAVFENVSNGNTNDVLVAKATGFSPVANFEATFAGNGHPALRVTHAGIGAAGRFVNTSLINDQPAVDAQTAGSGSAIKASTTGTGDAVEAAAAGNGQGLHATSSGSGSAIWSRSFGNASAGEFSNNLGSNTKPAVSGKNFGQGSGVLAQGTGGPALEIAGGGIKVAGAGINTGTAAFIHQCTDANTPDSGPYGNTVTIIDNPLCNNRPGSILIVTPRMPSSAVTQTPVVSVAYNGSTGRWQLYADSLDELGDFDDGDEFNVLVINF